MPAITPSFLFDLESNMRVIANQEYDRLAREIWWPQIMKVGQKSESKKERITWLLDTAQIKKTGKGGNVEFDDIVSATTEMEFENAAGGLKLKKEQLEDVDGNGIDFAAHWARQMGSYAQYWPQKMLAQAIIANGNTYDGTAYFGTAHPFNPFNTGLGTFKNVFTGAASGAYPGAVVIDSSVSVEQAFVNLQKALAYIATIKLPNGEDPRFLRVSKILVPPALAFRAAQLTNAKFIASAVSGGAGSTDVEAVVRMMGIGEPIVAYELGSAFGGSDTDFYLVMEEITSNTLGAFLYVPRTEFSILYYGPQNDAQLARIKEYQWTTEGRNGLMPGHPYLMFKCRAT